MRSDRAQTVRGTGSSLGKTLLGALRGRLFRRAGLAVASFQARTPARGTAPATCGGEVAVARSAPAAGLWAAPRGCR